MGLGTSNNVTFFYIRVNEVEISEYIFIYALFDTVIL